MDGVNEERKLPFRLTRQENTGARSPVVVSSSCHLSKQQRPAETLNTRDTCRFRYKKQPSRFIGRDFSRRFYSSSCRCCCCYVAFFKERGSSVRSVAAIEMETAFNWQSFI